MKPICLIPARSGSRGLKDKNMLYLDGKPMVFHTIEAALESGCFHPENIFVSTDSELYYEICDTLGVQVLHRPKELATDEATTFEVNQDFLQPFDEEQVFVLLQPTSPLRNGRNIREAMELFLQTDCENVVSFAKVEKSPRLFSTLDAEGFAKDICGVDKGYRRQNHQALYYPNGGIFISSKGIYLKNESYFTPKTKAYLMDKETSLDVDDGIDFKYAIRSLYFNYPKRERTQKEEYRNRYDCLDRERRFENTILGDSRLLNLQIDHFDNFSLGGVTLHTALENLDVIFRHPTKKMILSLGVNDLIHGYSLEEIKKSLQRWIEETKKRKVELLLTTVVYTLFRAFVSNEDIKELNAFFLECSAIHRIKIVDLNVKVSKDCHLQYAYTEDGLHFNEEGQAIVYRTILEGISNIKEEKVDEKKM